MANVAALPSITESLAGAPRLRDETLPGLAVRNLTLSVADSDLDSMMERRRGRRSSGGFSISHKRNVLVSKAFEKWEE